jgi:hypothetical protein
MKQPIKVAIRMYNVGFGDCFLLTFYYEKPTKNQHILIDFGSVAGKADLRGIAKDIKEACEGKLYAVVATHRHRDHISGFSDAGGETSPGAIIASCKPEIVIQPWTENPKARPNAKSAHLTTTSARKLSDLGLFVASLDAMQGFADTALHLSPRWRGISGRLTALDKLAANNAKNPDAVKNLRTMGKKPPRFLQYGSTSGLEDARLLPGVKVRVLGPPTLTEQNLKKYAKKSGEYWLACTYWTLQERAYRYSGHSTLFPRAPHYGARSKPFHTRWFMQRAADALKSNVLGIVTVLDKFLNNTSLILLFEVKGKKLLFPGDAQLENWSWALSKPEIRDLLKDVDLYKVGHHGSRNATPKTLWTNFRKRKAGRKGGALKTMMSTSPGVYARTAEGKVPSAHLVKALKAESSLSNTQDLKTRRGPIVIEF